MTARIPGNKLGVFWGGKGDQTCLEVFCDFNCPFSNKICTTLFEVKKSFGSKLELVFLPTPQPWHPSSCMVHECYHAATALSPSKTEDIFMYTMEIALQYFSDVDSYEMSRKAVHEQMADLYMAKGLVDKEAFLQAVRIEIPASGGEKNAGNEATRLVKMYTKHGRYSSIHVTPTTRVNGIICDTSSSWTVEEFAVFLQPLVDAEGI